MKLVWLLFSLSILCNISSCQNHKIKPNIVFILADDLGWSQLGCYGSNYYHTPNIDKLAEQGMRYTNAYAAAAICSPTRASILTGKCPARLRLTDFIPGTNPTDKPLLTPKNWQKWLPLNETTIAEALKENGYKTALFGKWHLSKEKTPPGSLPFNPAKQGFDESFVTYKPTGGMKQKWQTAEWDAHNIDTITNRSIQFLAKHKSEPFFLMVSHNAIHDPLMSKSELIQKYEQNELSEKDENHPIIGAMIESLDMGVGRILNAIKELGLVENTIVIFYSDNGGKHAYANQKPLRAGKGWLYEGGIREPLIVRWPGKIKAGSSCNTMVSSIDFYPTFLEIATAKIEVSKEVDGVSLLPTFSGEELKRDRLFWHYPHYHNGSGMVPASAIRWGKYKLIEWHEKATLNNTHSVELFNLQEDIGEKVNLVDEHPEIVEKLLNELHVWQKELEVQMPVKNESY